MMKRLQRYRTVVLTVCCLLIAWQWRTPVAQASVTAQGTALPDLVIAAVTVNPPNPGAGATADISIKIKNQGDATTTTSFRLYLYVDPGQAPPTQATVPTAQSLYGLRLAPGGEFTYTRTGHLFTTANPTIYVWVDPPWENRIAERDESNNLYPQQQSGPGADAFEEDDSCTQAKAISTDGSEQSRNLAREGGPDVDWVQFSGTGGVTYYAQASADGADADLYMELHGICDGPPPLHGGVAITFTAPADGPYYLKIAHNQNDYGPATAYRLRVSSNAGCVDTYELNDLCSQAQDLLVGTPQNHAFCKPGDVDWSAFPVTAGATYQVATSDVGAQANVQLGLFESCDDTGDTGGQNIEFTALTGGFVYLQTRNTDAAGYGPATAYTVAVTQVGSGCAEDSLEPNDNQDQAKALTVDGAVQTHNVCPAGDEDWAKFTATAGITYTVETLNLGAATDTELCLFTAAAERLACDDDNGAGKGSRLIWPAPSSGDYFLRAKDLDPTIAGPTTTYDLQVRTTSCDADSAEPDDNQAAARAIAADGTIHQRNVCPAGNADWFTFSGTSGATYTIETLDNGPEADTVISFYDSAGTLLAENDDHTAGVGSQVVQQVTQDGAYFVRVQLYNPTNYGTGTTYGLRVLSGTPTPTPTPSPTNTPPPATPTPTPQPSGLQTLILVNHAQLAQQYGAAEADRLLAKLTLLAAHSAVNGLVVRLENNSTISDAYAQWNASSTNVNQANMVAAAIRQLILTQRAEHSTITYIVLVGDDQALPFRRLYDNTPQQSEKTYSALDLNHPTGAALKENYFLSDDYYAATAGLPFQGRELYLPDVAIGRLIETPAEMIRIIDDFLTNPVTVVDRALITGYDFVRDQAQADCTDWQSDLGNGNVACLIADARDQGWGVTDFRANQLAANPPYRIQSINGHANHFLQGAPGGGELAAREIYDTPLNLSGGLIYTLGCHSGLNVPATNSQGSIDLAQAFISKGATYVGNTGYGWGLYYQIGLSEQLIRLYTQALVRERAASMGGALMLAKQRYYSQGQQLNNYDEKVLQQLTLYGLPMRKVETGAALGDPGTEFPGVQVIANLPPNTPSFGVSTGFIEVDFSTAQQLALQQSANGNYYTLNSHTYAAPNQPLQALYYQEFSVPDKAARGVVLVGGNYTVEAGFAPLITAPDNEFVNLAPAVDQGDRWQPAIPLTLQTHQGKGAFVAQLGQYNGATQSLRRYSKLHANLYYSNDADQVPPTISLVDSRYLAGSGQVAVKVEASDNSPIHSVIVTYLADRTQPQGEIKSLVLTFDPNAQKWQGTFNSTSASTFMVAVVDQAGNVSNATNKGRYYAPAMTSTLRAAPYALHLPLVNR